MSRSYKRSNVCADHRSNKRYANHVVRNHLKNEENVDLPHAYFKRMYNSYDICDFIFHCSWEDWREGWRKYHPNKPISDKELYRKWVRYYKRK